MKVIRNKYIPFGYSKYVNLFGILFCKPKANISKEDLTHETIHTLQMKELLYILFYIIYGLEWIFWLLMLRDFHLAYRSISFEVESHDHDINYINKRKHFAQWLINSNE